MYEGGKEGRKKKEAELGPCVDSLTHSQRKRREEKREERKKEGRKEERGYNAMYTLLHNTCKRVKLHSVLEKKEGKMKFNFATFR